MRWAKSRFNSAGGFSLIETLISVGLLTTVSLGVAQLFGIAVAANRDAKGQTSNSVLAQQKIEQLRSLTWGFDPEGTGLPVTDLTSDISVYPPTQSGLGLNPSPANALNENVAGYFDYADGQGNWVGNGSTPPAGAVYVRRWSIEPLPTNPNNTLIFQVIVVTIARENQRIERGIDRKERLRDDAWLVSVKTRKAP
jgi:type II secretory pathway pseudopilin PulG